MQYVFPRSTHYRLSIFTRYSSILSFLIKLGISMPRPLRIEFENAQYHIMNRGAGKKYIYRTRLHREIFIKLLEEAHRIFGIEIHAYCLMTNHYHLLVKTPLGNLARTMRHINGVYTQKFNKTENTDGPLFRGRYKAVLVSYDEYFLNVSRYIHLNPVTANIVVTPEQFEWSSYKYFYYPIIKPSWLNIEDTLSLFRIDNALDQYNRFINQGIDSETITFYEKSATPAIFGSKDFKDKLVNELSKEKIRSSSTDYRRTRTYLEVDNIVQICASFFNINPNELLLGKRGTINQNRAISIYACRIWSKATLANIADMFYCNSHSNISDIISNMSYRIKNENTMQNIIDKLFLCIGNNRQTST